jgi:hypothetical protein
MFLRHYLTQFVPRSIALCFPCSDFLYTAVMVITDMFIVQELVNVSVINVARRSQNSLSISGFTKVV